MDEGFVSQEEFCQLLNDHVFSPNLGHELTPQQAKDIVHSLADVVAQVSIAGRSVRFGRLGMFKVLTTPAGVQWNPATKKKVPRPKRRRLIFRASKSTRQLLTI